MLIDASTQINARTFKVLVSRMVNHLNEEELANQVSEQVYLN